MLKSQSITKKSLDILLVLTLLFTLFTVINPAPAEAKTDYSPPATAGLQVNVIASDNTVTQVANFSLTQLQSWTQHEERYSSIDSGSYPVGTVASGVYLSEVLAVSGNISTADVASIKLYCTDNVFYKFSQNYLWGSPRYYYPNLIPTWDDGEPGSGADNGAVEVQPILALTCYQERSLDLVSTDGLAAARVQMSREDTLRFCFGQTADDIANSTMTTGKFSKWVYRMDVTLNEGVTPPAANDLPLSSPILSASYTAHGTVTGTVGQSDPISITFTEDGGAWQDWREKITGITVNGNSLNSGDYTVESGEITIDADCFPEAGTHWVVISATGYTDDCATQIMVSPPALATPAPVLSGSTLSWTAITNAVEYEISITPSTVAPIIQEATSLDLTGLALADGIYSITVKALAEEGEYSDSAASSPVTYTVGNELEAPDWTADSTNNIVGQPITLTYSSDNTDYGQAIFAVSINGTALDSNLYDKTVDGELTLGASLFTSAGNYIINISADGYFDATVTQTVFDTAPALAALTLSGNPVLTYKGETLRYVLTSLTLTGIDQYGAAYDITEETVTWQVHSGSATVSGSTLTINASGTVTVSATIDGITSNLLNLTVYSAAGIPNPGYPDEIILSWTDDSSTTQTIAWRTGTDTTQNQIQYLSVADYSGSFSGAQSATAVQSELYEDNYHFEVTLTGLSPETKYIYRVGGGDVWSEPSYFTTDGNGSDFSFLYMGDVQEGIDTWGTLLENVYTQNPDLAFGLMGGDFVDIANSTSEWEHFLTGVSSVFSQIPLMPTVGNHEEPTPGNLVDYPLYWSSFALPENGPDGYEEQFYSFDYGTCHVAVLDSNIMGTTTSSSTDYTEIGTWLQNDLNNSNQPWKLLVFHHPAYPVVSDAYASVIQQYWAPLFEQCGVDMAFVGHQHVYMRSNPMYDGQPRTGSQQGTVYIMGNAGSKYYALGLDEEFQYAIAEQIAYTTNYELININGNTLTMVAYDDEGNVIDSYTIVKPEVAYTVTPKADDDIYQTGTTSDGICTMTVNSGVSGFKYFSVDVIPVTEHRGEESVVFVQMRNGVQIGINVARANFDVVPEAQTGLDVQPGDVIKAYLMDNLDSATDSNPNVYSPQATTSPGNITATLSCGDNTEEGNTVTVTGTASPGSWVGIKIVDNATQNNVFFDAVKTGDDGNYSGTFLIPEGTGSSLTVVVGSDYDVVASTLNVSLQIKYIISISVASGKGSITANPTTVRSGGSSVITISPADGYHLATITDNDADVFNQVIDNTYAISNITVEHTITVTFALNTYTLTVNMVGFGSVSKNPDQTVYTYGTKIVLAATADSGWSFTAWSGDLSGSINPKTITMNSDKTVMAAFAKVRTSKTETTAIGNVTVNAKTEAATEVDKSGTGTPKITVSDYASNPGAGFTGDTGKYIDVHVDNVTDVDEIVIRLYYTEAEISGLVESTLTLRWWNGTDWVSCSDSSVNMTDIAGPPAYSGYMWAKIRNDTTPTLDDLSGAVFNGGGTTKTMNEGGDGGGGGGGGGGASSAGTTNVRGLVSSEGRFTSSVTVISADKLCTIDIPEGTVGLDKNLEPITKITLVSLTTPPALPAEASMISLTYNLGPEGATFDPPVTISFSYDPARIPSGVSEQNLVLAFYDETAKQWVTLSDIMVDTVTHTISGKTSHFTAFSVIAYTHPAAFTASDLVISPTAVNAGESVNISADITNTGDITGSYEVVLKVNDTEAETKKVELSGHASQTVVFTMSKDVAGSYAVSIDTLSGEFMVKAMPATTAPTAPAATESAPITPEPTTSAPATSEPVTPVSTNWGLIGGLIAIAIVIIGGVLVYFLWWKKRPAVSK